MTLRRGAYSGWLRSKREPKTLGERIQAIRVGWGWTQEDLAKKLNTDRRQISLYERDKTQPSKATQALLAGFLGIPIEALVAGEGFFVPDPPSDESQGPDAHGIQISLPPLAEEHLMAVSLPNLQAHALTFPQAKELLGELRKTKGRAWIIFEKP